MTVRNLALAALALLAACTREAPPGDPAKAESYALNVLVEPATGGPLQRLDLPAAALVAARTSALADVRVFDAFGRPMSAARIDTPDTAQLSSHAVRVWMVEGSAAIAAERQLEITLGDGTVARVGKSDPSRPATTIAALLDTRALSDPAMRLELDVGLPAQQPVTFALQSSADLKSWQDEAEQVLFRPGDSDEALGGSRIDLGGASLSGRFLKVSWAVEGGSPGSVAVHGARVVTSRIWRGGRFSIEADGLVAEDLHTLRFDNPARLPFAAVELVGAPDSGVVPVKLYARNNKEAPWVPLGGAVLRGAADPAQIELGGSGLNQFRLVADARTAGFSAPPKLYVQLEPASLAVRFDGTPPYRLVAGLAGAPPTYLSAEELALGLASQVANLPTAKLAAGPLPQLSLAPAGKDSAFGGTRSVLWLALLTGVAVLVFAVWRLMRGNTAVPAKD